MKRYRIVIQEETISEDNEVIDRDPVFEYRGEVENVRMVVKAIADSLELD